MSKSDYYGELDRLYEVWEGKSKHQGSNTCSLKSLLPQELKYRGCAACIDKSIDMICENCEGYIWEEVDLTVKGCDLVD